MTKDELADRLLEFAARIGRLVDALPESRLGRHIAGQLVRSGTAPAPNYEEGCSAESRNNFIHKLSICLKELRETRMWLRLIGRAALMKPVLLTELIDECEQLGRIIGKSVVTAKENARAHRV